MAGSDLPKPDKKSPIRIRTPHAAILIWNYDDRLGSTPKSADVNTKSFIISTHSAISIQTSKSKSDPQGTFQFTLAPNRNWVAELTPGSWCAILMSNSPITQKDTKFVNPQMLKMVGKIDTVRIGTRVDDTGARNSTYYVSGIDWGHVFHNIIYIDNNLAAKSDPSNQGGAAAIAIQKLLFGEKGMPKRFTTVESLSSLLQVFGKELVGFTSVGKEIGLLANALYTISLPQEMIAYLGLKSGSGVGKATNLNSSIKLVSGALQTTEDKYTETNESYGFIDPYTLQGAHSFWQVLMDNSNPTMNEMIAEMRPDTLGTQFMLYNRIKPFALRGDPAAVKASVQAKNKVTSYFQNIKTHLLDPMTIVELNAGTNWKDKYNFCEIKPQFQTEKILEASIKQQTQAFDDKAFQREGFRPMIATTKHFPGPLFEASTLVGASWNELTGWVKMMAVWYFDTHKMLNGTISLTGIDGYIAVGDNIKFDASLVNLNNNINNTQAKSPLPAFILAHVENVSHSFSVSSEGARTYSTNVQFVRGIVVNEAGLSLATNSTSPGAIDNKRPGNDGAANRKDIVEFDNATGKPLK